MLIVLGIAFVFCLSYVGRPSLFRAETRSAQAGQNAHKNTHIPTCPDGPLFDTLPMELSDFKAFRPLGFLSPPNHLLPAKHSSFSINLPGESTTGKLIRFPGAATVTEIWTTASAEHRSYQLIFYPCRDFKAYFFHLGSISSRLQRALHTQEDQCEYFQDGRSTIKKCRYSVSLSVTSGEVAGTSDGLGGVDFGAADYRLSPHPFANPKRYDNDYLHNVSPVDYFSATSKAQLETKLASLDGSIPRTDLPRAGTHMQDIQGTAQGNWFKPGSSMMTSSDGSSFIALAHDYIDTAQPLFSIGTALPGVPMGLYGFSPRFTGQVNRDFSTITSDGTVYCYQDFLQTRTAGWLPLGTIDGIILIAMPTPTTLQIEKISAPNCQSGASFSTHAKVFER